MSESTSDGSSVEKAIVVTSVAAEYRYLAMRFPGQKSKRQELRFEDGKPYDVLVIDDSQGVEHRVWFDISGFFGKG